MKHRSSLAMTFDASSRALIAGALWLIAGITLVWRGMDPYWIEIARHSVGSAFLLLIVAAVLGILKGWFILKRSAQRVLRHIEARPGRQGLVTLYPQQFYPLLVVMILFGVGLRAWLGEALPAIVSVVYIGIGAALLSSSAPYFHFWRTTAHTN